jgi:preprotein translocase subunit SecG
MNTFLLIIHVFVCLSIIIVVLLQVGRGAELGAAFGSMGQANASRGAVSFMSKFTTVMAVMFMITSFTLTYITSNVAKQSVIDKVSSDAVQTVPANEEKATPTDKEGVTPDTTEQPTPNTAEKNTPGEAKDE